MHFRPLLLAGGQSSRMGTRKELLRLPSGNVMFVHLLQMLHEVFPELNVFYMSTKSRDTLNELLSTGHIVRIGERVAKLADKGAIEIQFLFDSDTLSPAVHGGGEDIGPAAGLIAAHCADPAASWLVVACDFPLLEVSALRQLLEEFRGPLACYRNCRGFVEPLLAIWSPEALEQLQGNAMQGKYGPRFVTEQVNAQTILPAQNRWLFNANTTEEWREALRLLMPSSSNGNPEEETGSK
ncbi:uncharacterized protein A1O9_02730 [Exophiala aquamarina CBS 119918]|uniref:MobA-like NTP transferase domain-containing protein n=1 Tax=Exophiala aquamarina CBS 119918 TaxID=1182545 RepID=A0A072PZU0_9EURO|nr:uncharacterized protein A1O9_02730 [Exophiala aquamarina CBS 119918]KEF61165.1 hypothetical protein A1O9_02730 [Exophiala aquamarina CBS 119918]